MIWKITFGWTFNQEIGKYIFLSTTILQRFGISAKILKYRYQIGTFSRVGADCGRLGAPPALIARNLGRNITQWLESNTILQYFRPRVGRCNIIFSRCTRGLCRCAPTCTCSVNLPLVLNLPFNHSSSSYFAVISS